MPRNQLKRFPTAVLRRGMAHFHPGAWPAGRTRVVPAQSRGPIARPARPAASPPAGAPPGPDPAA